MAISLLISGTSVLTGGKTPLYEVGQHCHKIDPIKLRASFPFGDFELPTFKYTVLRERLDQIFLNKTDFITTVSGRGLSKVEFKSEVENQDVKGTDFYTIHNTLSIPRLNYEQEVTKTDDEEITYINLWNLASDLGVVLMPVEFIDYYRSPYDFYGYGNDERSRGGVTRHNLYLKREGGYIRNFQMLEKALASMRWFFSNASPLGWSYFTNKNKIALLGIITLVDPYLSDPGDPFILDESLIKKQSQKRSMAGFEISRDIIDRDEVDLRPFNKTQTALGFPAYFANTKKSYKFPAYGAGKSYNINMTSPPENLYIKIGSKYYNLLSEYGAYLEAKRIALYYLSKIRSGVLTVETLQDTNIVPYRSVSLANTKYYCVEARLDIRNDGINKYVLQRRVV